MTRSNDPFRDHLFPVDRPEGCDEWCAALHVADEMFRHHPDPWPDDLSGVEQFAKEVVMMIGLRQQAERG